MKAALTSSEDVYSFSCTNYHFSHNKFRNAGISGGILYLLFLGIKHLSHGQMKTDFLQFTREKRSQWHHSKDNRQFFSNSGRRRQEQRTQIAEPYKCMQTI